MCKFCGHAFDDHDGYAGLCDGLHTEARKVSPEAWNAVMDSREMCGCMNYVEED